MPLKRKYAYGQHGARVRRKFAPRFGRRKLGARRYFSKAFTSVKQRRPTRFRYSRAANRLNSAVAQSIRGMAETKVIGWRASQFREPAPTSTGDGISYVKFIAGQTPVTTYPDYLPVGGFLAPQGDGKNNRDGQFIWLKGSTVNLTIQANHTTVVGRPAPIHFRVIVFKTKRALSPMGTTVVADTDLFLTNSGGNVGDSTASPNNMKPQDMMLQPINTNNFAVLMDKKFRLGHTQTTADQSGAAETNPQALNRWLGSVKNFRINLKHASKTRYDTLTNEPNDLNYRWCFAIYAYYPEQAPSTQSDTPLGWSASIRGTTTFMDV